MAETAQGVTTERSTTSVQEEEGKIVAPTSVADIHHQAVDGITDSLAQAGHLQTPIQVSADGEAETVLAKIEAHAPGAQIVGASVDHLTKGLENLGGDFGGSKREYKAEGGSGVRIAMARMARRVLDSGVAQKIRHIKFWKEKK